MDTKIKAKINGELDSFHRIIRILLIMGNIVRKNVCISILAENFTWFNKILMHRLCITNFISKVNFIFF